MASISVLQWDEDSVCTPLIERAGSAKAVARPDVGARHRMVNVITLDPGGRTKSLRYDDEAVYYIESGSCQFHAGSVAYPLEQGAVAFLPPGVEHVCEAIVRTTLIGGPVLGFRERSDADRVQVLNVREGGIMLPMISREARHVVGPHIGAQVATLNYVSLDPGESNEPHVHTEAEDTIIILEGEGTIADETNGVEHSFGAGCILLIPAGLRHAVRNTGKAPIRSIGGPCPPDLSMTPGIRHV